MPRKANGRADKHQDDYRMPGEAPAPEQVAGEPPIDGRADVYSLGCILFEILAGVALHRIAQQESEQDYKNHKRQGDKRRLGPNRCKRAALRPLSPLLQQPLLPVIHQSNRLLALLHGKCRKLRLQGEVIHRLF